MTNSIVVKDLWKKYKIDSSKSLTEEISNIFFARKPKYFWALKSVNLRIVKGETVGIIGLNGSGKSTLLKIIAKITYPTLGEVTTNGKVTTLLELGTGFHQELTGYENIYLYATIMGISLRKITGKFDKIVRFSGVKKFINMPLKHYSSGMYARLAISTALFSDPDIYLIDESLVVGDIEFQQRCFNLIKSLKSQGLTTIIVSHDLNLVNNFCDRAVFLHKGEIVTQGKPNEVTYKYWSMFHNKTEI